MKPNRWVVRKDKDSAGVEFTGWWIVNPDLEDELLMRLKLAGCEVSGDYMKLPRNIFPGSERIILIRNANVRYKPVTYSLQVETYKTLLKEVNIETGL